MLFGILCAVVLPLAAIFWAIASEVAVSLPPFQSNIFGLVLLIFGSVAYYHSFHNYFGFRRRLPMSPFPPAKFCIKGDLTELHPIPIYVGACSFFVRAFNLLWISQRALSGLAHSYFRNCCICARVRKACSG